MADDESTIPGWLPPIAAGLAGVVAGVVGTLIARTAGRNECPVVRDDRLEVMQADAAGHVYIFPSSDMPPTMAWVDHAMLHRLAGIAAGATYGRSPSLTMTWTISRSSGISSETHYQRQTFFFDPFSRFATPDQIGKLFRVDVAGADKFKSQEKAAKQLLEVTAPIVAEGKGVVVYLEILSYDK